MLEKAAKRYAVCGNVRTVYIFKKVEPEFEVLKTL
jgi:hypothetical protein